MYNTHMTNRNKEQEHELYITPSKRDVFPKTIKFSQAKGVWTHIDYNNKEVSSSNLYDFEHSNGLIIRNNLHSYGYKYNRLYNMWKIYDFSKEMYV